MDALLTYDIRICLYPYMKHQETSDLVEALRALGEPTRLRILDVLSVGELTVSELCEILAMSQPRISRHLRILSDNGLLIRHAEGSWVFYRHASSAHSQTLISTVLSLYPNGDLQRARDKQSLRRVQQKSIEKARNYFRRMARSWDSVQQLYVPEKEIEQAIRNILSELDDYRLIDMGTGTGRILELLAGDASEGIGIDSSVEMLAIARSKLLQRQLGHCRLLRQDLTDTTLPEGCADVVILHHVLHYLDEPGSAITESARLLAPSGMIVIVDFAPHELESLRHDHSHRRLGYRDSEIRRWCEAAGLQRFSAQHLAMDQSTSTSSLTAVLWSAYKSHRRRGTRKAA